MIELDHITKSFGRNMVLKDITLKIDNGKIFGLIGKNGAGKTTLLSIIAGLSNPTNGECLINGCNISIRKRSVKIGYLPDVPAFFDMMTVDEFMAFLYKKESGYKQKRDNLLRLVGLNGKTIIKTMSRGMRQRLGMAAALVNDPDIILLDEPSSALDPMGRFEISNLLLYLKQQGKTIILSTHILTDMENICDRVGFLHDGVIVKTISPNDIGTSQRIILSFENAIDTNLFVDLPLNVIYKNSNTIIISGDLRKKEMQNALMCRLCQIGNPITHMETVRTDLDAVFREVCQ